MASAPTPEDVAQDNARRRAAQDARWTQIKYEKSGRVATVTLNRPTQRNALGRAMATQLDEAFLEACADDEVLFRVSGFPSIFCLIYVSVIELWF